MHTDTNTQVTLLFRYKRLLTSGLSSTRGDRQFLKVFRNHTMLTTSFNGRNPTLCPNGRNSTIVFHDPTSRSQLPGRTQLLNCLSLRQTTQLSVYMAQCQHSNCLFLKIFKFSGTSLPGMTSFTLQLHLLSRVYYDERRVQSPTKLNEKI